MKSLLRGVLSLFLLFFLIGCGSSSKKNSGTESVSVSASTDTSGVIIDSSGNIVVEGKIYVTDSSSARVLNKTTTNKKIVLKNLRFTMKNGDKDCIISSNPPQGSTVSPDFSGAIEYSLLIDPTCSEVKTIDVNATKEVTKEYSSGSVKSEPIVVKEPFGYQIPVKLDKISSNSVKLKILNYNSSLNVNKTETFNIQIVDNKDKQFPDETIKSVTIRTNDSSRLKLIDDTGSQVNKITYSNSAYNSVKLIALKEGVPSLNISVTLRVGGTDIVKTKTLTFNFIKVIGKCKVDRIFVKPSGNIVVNGGGISSTLNIYAVDSDNNPVQTDIELPHLIDKDNNVYGTFDNYTVTTDDKYGVAVATYTAPTDIGALVGTTKTFTITNSECKVSTNITLDFPKTDVVYDFSIKTVGLGTSIVNEKGTDFKVQLLDKDGKQLSDSAVESVYIKTNDASKVRFMVGDKLSNEVTFNSAYNNVKIVGQSVGTGSFDIVAKVSVKGKSVTKSSTISVSITASTGATCGLSKIIIDPKSFIVNGGGATQKIKVYTLDSANKPISSKLKFSLLTDGTTIFGTLDKYEITTAGTSGEGEVTYTAPVDITPFSGVTKNFQVTGCNGGVSAMYSFTFKKDDTADKLVEKLLISPKSFKVTKGSSQVVSIYTLNQKHQPVSAIVKIGVPEKNGTMYGEFDNYVVETDTKGKGTVTYTAPDNADSLSGDINISFVVQDDKAAKDGFLLHFQKPEEVKKSKQYNIESQIKDVLSVDKKGSLVVTIKRDGFDELIDDNNIFDVKIESENKLIYFGTDTTKYSYEYNQSATKSIDIHSRQTAGVEVFKITAQIFDGEKNVTLTEEMPVTIISGPPASISLLYLTTSYNDGLFEDKYRIYSADKYGNPAREGSKIYVGAVNGLVKSGSKNLYVKNGGKISYSSFTKFDLTDGSYNFSNVKTGDTLVILGTETKKDPLYMGGWIIDDVGSSELGLDTSYSGSTTDNLSFVVGNEQRFDTCDNQLKQVDFDSEDKLYQLGADGTTYVKLRYPPFMVGKDVYLYATSFDEKRVGTSLIKKLFGLGAISGVKDYEKTDQWYYEWAVCPDNGNCRIKFPFKLNTTGGALKNTDFLLADFEFNGCNDFKISMIKSNTSCDGNLIFDVNTTKDDEKNVSCQFRWNGSIPRDEDKNILEMQPAVYKAYYGTSGSI